MSKRDVMVCVTGQKNCERLIREGAQIASIREVGVHVVHVAHEGERFMERYAPTAIKSSASA